MNKETNKAIRKIFKFSSMLIIYLVCTIFILMAIPNVFKSCSEETIKEVIISKPKPVVVDKRITKIGDIFDYGVEISANIRNKGKDGYIMIEAGFIMSGKEYKKEKKIYLDRNEEKEYKFEFMEYETTEDINWYVRVNPYESMWK